MGGSAFGVVVVRAADACGSCHRWLWADKVVVQANIAADGVAFGNDSDGGRPGAESGREVQDALPGNHPGNGQLRAVHGWDVVRFEPQEVAGLDTSRTWGGFSR